jgi:hypothetical protein
VVLVTLVIRVVLAHKVTQEAQVIRVLLEDLALKETKVLEDHQDLVEHLAL